MPIEKAMKNQITLGNLLTILIPVFVIIITWGNSVETRLTESNIRITNNERINNKVLNKLDEIIRTDTKDTKLIFEELTYIKVALENKQNRD